MEDEGKEVAQEIHELDMAQMKAAKDKEEPSGPAARRRTTAAAPRALGSLQELWRSTGLYIARKSRSAVLQDDAARSISELIERAS